MPKPQTALLPSWAPSRAGPTVPRSWELCFRDVGLHVLFPVIAHKTLCGSSPFTCLFSALDRNFVEGTGDLFIVNIPLSH